MAVGGNDQRRREKLGQRRGRAAVGVAQPHRVIVRVAEGEMGSAWTVMGEVTGWVWGVVE